MTGSVASRWKELNGRVLRACERAKRPSSSVRIVAVTKQQSLEQIEEAYEAGARIFGENYVQEALPKITSFQRSGVEWHFIGALQSNKARKIIGPFSLLHSLDRWSLAQALDKGLRESKISLPVLLEVNLGEEATKSGSSLQEWRGLVQRISDETHLQVAGLMVFPPLHDDPERSRPYFQKARELFKEIAELRLPRIEMKELSMGVSHDFEVAIEEGATLVRLGTAIFGPRRAI